MVCCVFFFFWFLSFFSICCVERVPPGPFLVKVPTYLYNSQLHFYSPANHRGAGYRPAMDRWIKAVNATGSPYIHIYGCTCCCSPNLKLCGPDIPKYKYRSDEISIHNCFLYFGTEWYACVFDVVLFCRCSTRTYMETVVALLRVLQTV